MIHHAGNNRLTSQWLCSGSEDTQEVPQEIARHSRRSKTKDVICCIKKDGFEFFAILETVHDGEAGSELPRHTGFSAIV